MSSSIFQKILLGQESTLKTRVNPTTVWRGNGPLADERVRVRPEENVGLATDTTNSYLAALGGKLPLASTPGTFEQLCYLLEGGIKKVTPVQDGVGSGYIRTYPFPTTEKQTLQPYTVQAGNNTKAEEMEGSFITDFQLNGKIRDSWMMQGSLQGAQVQNIAAFQSGVAIPTVEEMIFLKSKLFIDDVSGSFGTTQVEGTWLNAALKIVTGYFAQDTGDGELFYNHIGYNKMTAMLDLTFLHNSVSVAQKEVWRAGTPKLLQILIEGEDLATPGTTYTKKTIIIKLAGLWDKINPLGEENKVNTMTGTFGMGYDGTAGTNGEIIVVNELATLP